MKKFTSIGLYSHPLAHAICYQQINQFAGLWFWTCIHLLQQTDPSPGWAQQAPLFSSLFLSGVQQEVPSDGWEQQEDSSLTSWAFPGLFFCRTGMSVNTFSIVISFIYLYRRNASKNDALIFTRFIIFTIATRPGLYIENISSRIPLNVATFQQ